MRDRSKIWAAWRSGTQVGDTRPCTRVTVEKDWQLNLTDATVGTWKRGPARWWQPYDRNQRETELSNVVSVNMSRSLESDAGTCDITIVNMMMPNYGDPERLPGTFGTPGALTFDHGASQDARARWNHISNDWGDVLVPNALVRTYQGFGGHDKALEDALTDGDVILNGVWLVDDVQISSEGTISVKCRDMMKLLVDQQLYPPLVPPNLYPLEYKRWVKTPKSFPANLPPPADACYGGQYLNSSTDVYYGEWCTGATGHPGPDAFDITPESAVPFAHQATFWMSEPFGGPGDHAWIEFLLDAGSPQMINEIYYHPFEGALVGWPAEGIFYVMVSIHEHGQWCQPETAEFLHPPPGGITPEGIPFVSTFVPGRGPDMLANSNLFRLPREYYATMIRLTITNLVPSSPYIGGYRAGARKIMACYHYGTGDANYNNIVYAGTSVPANKDQFAGYWQARSTGQIYAFGDARLFWPNSPRLSIRELAMGMCSHPTGQGYWLVDTAGVVIAAGASGWYGDRSNVYVHHVMDIAAAPDGNGYWLLERDGTVHTYGSATNRGSSYHSAPMPGGGSAWAASIESHPTTNGFWVLWSDGFVDAKGVPDYGSVNLGQILPLESFTQIQATATGLGYWITSALGGVFCKGDAPDHGRSTSNGNQGARWYYGIVWGLMRSSAPGDKGYMLRHADGTLEKKGTIDDFGSIGSGSSIERSPGNYKDYMDIVADLLLWAGFYLRRDPPPRNQKPDVYGNLETTGIYSEDPLPPDMFDKRPIYDAIKDLRDIVGYIFYCDQEGGIRWESPSWWQIGNWLSDYRLTERTPFNHMPEIDESVNLISHSIQMSGGSGYSEIILANENVLPLQAGQAVTSKTLVKTRLEPKTKSMLRGMQRPYIRTHDKLSNWWEQTIMADLIEMKMWFSRRLGQISCTANPLIDLNDQVRVIERQTGEVYVHYVRSIETSHDLESGEYTMNLTTHWLGGGPFDKFGLFFAAVARPQGDGYWTITRGGTLGLHGDAKTVDYKSGLYAYGAALLLEDHEADSHTDEIDALRSTASGKGLYSLDQSGKVLTYGDAVPRTNASGQTGLNRTKKDVTAMALTPSGAGYWLLTRDGTVHPFGDAVWKGDAPPTGPTMGTNAIPNHAVDIESHPTTMGYWVLDGNGVVTARGVPNLGGSDRVGLGSQEFYTGIRRTHDGGGYWLLTGGGLVRNKGNAPFYGNANPWSGPWYNGLVWDMIINPDNSYILLRANGTFEAHGGAQVYTAVTRNETKYFALVPEGRAAAYADVDSIFPISANVVKFLKGIGSPSAANAVASDFGTPPDAKKKVP